MSQPPHKPVPYEVSPSGRVGAEMKALYRRARVAGFGPQVLAALKKLEHVLAIYPQYGEPLRDLAAVGETVYVVTFDPLFVQ